MELRERVATQLLLRPASSSSGLLGYILNVKYNNNCPLTITYYEAFWKHAFGREAGWPGSAVVTVGTEGEIFYILAVNKSMFTNFQLRRIIVL